MRAAAGLIALSLSGCALWPAGVSPDARLLQADREFAAASLRAGPAEAFYQFTTADALQLPADGEPLRGREAIRDSLSEGPPRVLNWQPQFAEVADDEDLGWTWGLWQLYETGAGGRRLAQGKYVNIWKKQPDDSWKVRLDLGNTQKNKP